MSSAVLELQREITQSDCDIVSVLRRAHLIASKLELKDFDRWIVNELNGYSSQDEAPEYRSVSGQLKALNPYNGWNIVLINEPKLEEIICHPKMTNSISEIVSFCNGDDTRIVMQIPGEVQNELNNMCNNPIPMQMAVHISKTSVADIIEKVKNTLIEWTLELETKGVLGEEMNFSDKEKEVAKSIPQQVNIYYGSTNVINGTNEKIQANAGNTVTACFEYELAKKAVSDIRDSIQESKDLSQVDREEALELLREISNKIEIKKKDTIIKAAFAGLVDFLISVGAGSTVALIQAKIQGLF